jgi:hypothetical protein
LCLVLLAMVCRLASAQTVDSQYAQEVQSYQALAVKFYPDCTKADSPLVKLMYKMNSALQANGSRLYVMSSKPLLLAVEAANILKISPRTETATNEDKKQLLAVIEDGLISTHDFTPPQSIPTSSMTSQSFNPGSMNGDVPVNETTTDNPAATQSSVNQPTVAGFHVFLYSLESQGHLWGQKNGPEVYRGGVLDGMTKDRAVIYAQDKWEQMSHDDQMVYEQKAQAYGDPIAQQQAEAAAHPTMTGTIQNANTGEVQWVNIH